FETRITGSNSYDATAGSDVCVITAGLPRKPGMSRMDLLEVNAKIVGDVTRQLVAASPDAVIIVVSNPLDEMTALCAQVSSLPRSRVIGQAGMLDTARFKHFVAERLDTSPSKVEAMTLGSKASTGSPTSTSACPRGLAARASCRSKSCRSRTTSSPPFGRRPRRCGRSRPTSPDCKERGGDEADRRQRQQHERQRQERGD